MAKKTLADYSDDELVAELHRRAMKVLGDPLTGVSVLVREPGYGWQLGDETKAMLKEIDDNIGAARIRGNTLICGPGHHGT